MFLIAGTDSPAFQLSAARSFAPGMRLAETCLFAGCRHFRKIGRIRPLVNPSKLMSTGREWIRQPSNEPFPKASLG